MRADKAIRQIVECGLEEQRLAEVGVRTAMSSVLYLGPADGTCLDRADALRRLGHRVDLIDPRKLLPRTFWVERVTWRLGGGWFAPWLQRAFAGRIADRRYDICWVDGGEWITRSVLSLLRKHATYIVNYNIDDPFGPRDGARFDAYRRTASGYDLCVVVREENVEEACAFGALDVMRVSRSADEVRHAPQPLTPEDHERWDCEVLFLGSWFPERGSFVLELVRQGVPLTIRGGRWHKAPEWAAIKDHWRGPAIFGDDYAKAIQCAKVSLGLVSKGNRDLHTTRSLEIPALGGLLCAERTTEHLAMYEEGTEALFWADVGECARMCAYALENEEVRRKIAAAGHARVRKNGHYNESILAEVLERLTRDARTNAPSPMPAELGE
jgi:spore maturation protein CgeB